MLKPDPDFADIYMLDTVLVVDDAHNAPRRAAVVQPRDDIVTVLGRTTRIEHFDESDCLMSPLDSACGLDKVGMFSERYKHSVSRSDFANETKCDFKGPLGAEARSELDAFWDRLRFGIS